MQKHKLGDLVKVKISNGIYKKAECFSDDADYLLLDVKCLYRGSKVVVTGARRVELSSKEYEKYKVTKGDILINRVSLAPEGIGKAALVTEEGNFVYESNMMRISIDEKKVVPSYLNELLQTQNLRNQILAKASIVAQASINQKTVEGLTVEIPPLVEQQKVAKILSTWDEAIEKLEKLIEAKRLRKKGLVQQLLTGKKRFGGYQVPWTKKMLSEITWFQEGPGLRKWQFTKEGRKVINITNLVDGYLDLSKTDRHISNEEFESKYKHFDIDAGDIVIASSGNSYCKHAIVREKDLPLVMNTSVIRFKPSEDTDYNFLNQFLKSDIFKKQIDILITGGAQPNFGPAHLKKIVLKIPEKHEQKRIGTFLNSLDIEIEIEKHRLNEVIKQKSGLMQQLLTGKKRVKVD